MQEQVMNLINSMATLIEEKFGDYFKEFKPLMERIKGFRDGCFSSGFSILVFRQSILNPDSLLSKHH
jgi:hypothetical protein